MIEFIIGMIAKYPEAASVFVVIGVLRAIFKPIMTTLEAYVEATPSMKDNKMLEDLKESKLYGLFVWFIDYTASIKLPKKK